MFEMRENKTNTEEKREWMHQTTLWQESQMLAENCAAGRERETVLCRLTMHKKTNLIIINPYYNVV